MTNNVMVKKSLKHVEIALNNFNEIAVPHHNNLLEEHKTTLAQVKNDALKVRNFQIAVRRTEAQLKSLLYELDTLRAQVNDDELDKFDMKTVSLRKSILYIINQYKEITKQLQTCIPIHVNKQERNEPKGQVQKQLKVSADLNELKLKEREACFKNVEQIQCDIQELHTAYGDLNQMVNEQGELVNKLDNNVDDAQHNVTAGVRHIITASRLKASMYPVTGAVMGGVVGGPIGLLAGLKIGSVAAVCCGCLGYFGGRILNKHSTPKQTDLNIENQLYNDNQVCTDEDTREKKDE